MPDLHATNEQQHQQEALKVDGSAPRQSANIRETMRKLDSGPSVHNTRPDKKHRQVPIDLIEEESMESFPASDPPGHTHSHTNRPEPRRPGQGD